MNGVVENDIIETIDMTVYYKRVDLINFNYKIDIAF